MVLRGLCSDLQVSASFHSLLLPLPSPVLPSSLVLVYSAAPKRHQDWEEQAAVNHIATCTVLASDCESKYKNLCSSLFESSRPRIELRIVSDLTEPPPFPPSSPRGL